MTTNNVELLLYDLVALPSVNPEGNATHSESPYGESRVADYVQRFFEPLGLRVERQAVLPGRDNVLVHVPGEDRSVPPILLEAHMDTVGVKHMAMPFTPHIERGRVCGRGACDTKASLAAMMLALRQLVEEEARLPRSVCLAATVDEEFAQSGVQRLVESEMQFSAAIVGEPTSLHVVAAHKGQVYFKVVTHGKAAHTSTPEHGLNAIYLMSDVIHVLRMRSTVEYSQRVHPLCGSPALTVAIIHGGSSEHVVPDACEIAVDCRLIPGESWPEAVAEMQRWVAEDLGEEDGKRVAFQLPYHNAPPMQTPIEHPLVQGLRQAAANVLGEAQVVGVPYNTDAGILSVCGVPSVVFGPGDIAQAHTDAEFVEIKQVTAGVEILKRFLLEYTA